MDDVLQLLVSQPRLKSLARVYESGIYDRLYNFLDAYYDKLDQWTVRDAIKN